jgi:hypothetical protein
MDGSAENAECEPRRAAALHERRQLMPVDVAGDGFGHRPGDAKALQPADTPFV